MCQWRLARRAATRQVSPACRDWAPWIECWRLFRLRLAALTAVQALEQGAVPVAQLDMPVALQAGAVEPRVERTPGGCGVGAAGNGLQGRGGFALRPQLLGDRAGEAEPGHFALGAEVIQPPGAGAAMAPALDQLAGGVGDAAGRGRRADLVGHHIQ